MRISLDNGHTFLTAEEAALEIEKRGLWDAVTDLMIDEIREAVHNDVAPCTDQEFLTAYLAAAPDDLILG